MKPLFLTAHYDDLEVCAGGTASRYGGLSVVLYPREDHGTEKEARAAADILGIETVNGKKHVDARNVVAWLDEIVEPYDTVIAANPWDSHPEHQAVAQYARELTRKNDRALWFMDHAMPGGVGHGPRPNMFVQYELTAKFDAIAAYEKMMAVYGEDWQIRTGARDLYYGWVNGGSGMAEGFIVENQTIRINK